MKKLRGLLVCLLAVGMLAGCSEDTTKKTTVCTGFIDGNEETLTFKGEGDKLIYWTEEAIIPLSIYNITGEEYANDNSILDLNLMKDYVMDTLLGDTEMKGVKIDLHVEGENLLMKLDMDYTKVDLDALVDAGFVESGALGTEYLSYADSIKAYKDKNDLTCVEK